MSIELISLVYSILHNMKKKFTVATVSERNRLWLQSKDR